MKVRALTVGFYNNRRQREGEEFELVPMKYWDDKGNLHDLPVEKQFSKLWMVEVKEDEESDGTSKKGKKKKAEKSDESLDEEVI